MKSISRICLVVLSCLLSCKTNDVRLPYEKPIDPAKDPSGFSRSLRIDGTNKGGDMPLNVSTSFRITKAQPSASATKGASLYVPFVFSSTLPVAGIYLQVKGADNHWNLAASGGQLTTDTYVFSVNFPKNVLDGNTILVYAAYDRNGRTSNAIQMDTEITSSQNICSADEPYKANGSRGLHQKTLVLGNKAGKVRIHYQMYNLPDRLDIRYNGQWVASTDTKPGPPVSSKACFDRAAGYVPGTGTLTVNYDPAKSRELEIYMSGCEGETLWDIQVDCPEEGCTGGCDTITLNDLNTSRLVAANTDGKFTTSIRVKAGEFVFFGTTSKVVVDKKHSTSVNGNGTNKGFDITKVLSDPGSVYFTYTSAWKKYADYRFGQLLMRFNGRLIAADNYSLMSNGKKCSGTQAVIDNYNLDEEYGNYFIADRDGIIEFEINDQNPSDNTGHFLVNIVTMSRKQHEDRNYCNRCPEVMPEVPTIKKGEVKDEEGNVWDYGFLENAFTADCFHGGHYLFRGKSDDVKNSQCAYSRTTKKLINTYGDNTMGTYDYKNPDEDPRAHAILDVFTHEAYEAVGFKYKPTCDVYMYKKK